MATSAQADRNAVIEKLTHTKAEHAHIISVIAADPGAPLTDILEKKSDRRRFVGPESWLSALREKTR